MATICSEQVCVVADARVNDRPGAGPRLSSKLSRFWSQSQSEARVQPQSQVQPQPEAQSQSQSQSQPQPQSQSQSQPLPSGHVRAHDEIPASCRSQSSGWRRLVQQFMQWMETRREQRENRDAFSHLLALDDTLLQDIGVTRAEVERAARLPLAENAAQSLHNATRDRYMKRA